MITAEVAALGRALADASVVVAILALVALALLAALERLPPSWKAWIWWLVAVRALVELAGVPAFEWSLLPARPSARPAVAAQIAVQVPSPTAEAEQLSPAAENRRPIRTALRHGSPRIDPWASAGAFWLTGVVAGAAFAARAALRSSGIVRRASPVLDPFQLALFERARAAAGVARAVDLRTSTEIDAPMAVGFGHGAILLPAGIRFSREELELALLHELAHLRRRDAWRALVPAIARQLFFFHPLVRRAEREFGLAVEAACDAEVVARRAAPADRYGRLLVRFAAASAPGARTAAAWPLAASPIHRRLAMLLSGSFDRRRLAVAAPLVVLVALALIVPVRLVAAPTDAPPAAPAAPPEAPSPPATPGPTAAPGAPEVGARWSAPAAPRAPRTPKPSRIAGAPLPARTPMPDLPPLPPVPPVPPSLELAGADWLVLIDGDTRWVFDAPRTLVRRAEQLAESSGGSALLVGRGGESYLAHERAAIDVVRSILDRQMVRAREQSRVARDQARAAREQASAARQEARRHAEQALAVEPDARRLERLAAVEAERMARLSEELARLGESMPREHEARLRAAAEQMAQLEQELAGLRRELEQRRLEDFSTLERELAEHRDEMLAEQQELREAHRRFAREMEESGRRQSEELGRTLDELFDDDRFVPLDEPPH